MVNSMKMETRKIPCKGLLERLKDGEYVVVAEGYVFELERRGYLQSGYWVPEVVLERPDLVQELHREFVHAGSDVVLALNYLATPKKLEIGEQKLDFENLNRASLRLAREVAYETGTLFAGNIGPSGAYIPDDANSHAEVKGIFEKQVKWSAEEGVDFMVGETFPFLGEALLYVKAAKEQAKEIPVVVTLAVSPSDVTWDGVQIEEAAKQLEAAGADVVGLNCRRGPKTIMPPIKKMKENIKVPVAVLPVTWRTPKEQGLSMLHLTDPTDGKNVWPEDIDIWYCCRKDIRKFGEECKELGIQYVGLCCGSCSRFLRTLAETLGRKPPASKYSPDQSKSMYFGDKGATAKLYNKALQEVK